MVEAGGKGEEFSDNNLIIDDDGFLANVSHEYNECKIG